MSKQLQLKIVTPERLILEETVDGVTLPTTEGEITILPDHVALIAGLGSGDVVALVNGEHVPIVAVGGFVEVKKENNVTIVAVLADFAEHVEDLTEAEIEKAKARAEELQKRAKNKEVIDFEHRFAAELEHNLSRVRIANKWGTRKFRKRK